MNQIQKLAEQQTKEQVDKQFDEFMKVFGKDESSVEYVLALAKEELDIFKVARAAGHLQRLNSWEAKQNHIQIKCPFHDDNNPSCSLWRDIGAFKCWSCGTRGDIITFIQLLQNTKKVPVGLIRKLLKSGKLSKNK